MLCQSCNKRAASVQYIQYINGEKIEIYLCEECAKQSGYMINGINLGISNFLSSFMGLMQPEYAHKDDIHKKPACEKCGLTFEQFQKNGRLGCDNCYSTYRNKLDSLFRRIQGGNVKHTGKTPKRAEKSIKNSIELEEQRMLLKKALQDENYEEAAILRDKIKKLEFDNKRGEGKGVE